MIIHKKELPLAPGCNLELPLNAKILCVQTQREVPHIWYSFEGDQDNVEFRAFLIITTGARIIDEGLERFNYLGSFQLSNGTFVGHVYYGR